MARSSKVDELNEKYTLEFLEDDLDPKKKQFCHEYIIDWGKARSYMKAYPDSTYEAAAVSANRLLKNAKIQQYIDFIKNDLEKEAGISKLRQMNTLIEIITNKETSQRDKISATAELNKMMGYNEPEKLIQNTKITITDNTQLGLP